MNKALRQAVSWWKQAGLDRFALDVIEGVLRRVAQGMTDREVERYLDHCKRGLPAGSEEVAVIEDVRYKLRTPGTRLYDDVQAVRTYYVYEEEENAAARRKLAKELMLEKAEREAAWVWWDEQRTKNSMIPPGSRGGRKNGRKWKKQKKAQRQKTYAFDVVVARGRGGA